MSQELKLTLGAVLFVIAATLITPFGRDLAVGDETKYGEVVREMRTTGAWFVPTLGGTPFTHKPPLHFWLIDALTYPLGLYSTWAFVLPSFAALLFLLWIVWRMGGAMAAFVCATSMMIWVSSQTARMDVSFTAFLTLAIWMLQRKNYLWSGVWLGVATLIKGPMAPVIVIVLILLERRRGNYWAGLAAMIVIPALWFIPAMLTGGDAYTHEVIVKQTVGRAIATWVHKAPPWYYLLHLPGIVFPWFILALLAVRNANRFYLKWILAVLLPYSLMSSKLDVYMMALIPPMALMIGEFVANVGAGFSPSRGGLKSAPTLCNLAMLALLALAGLALPFIPNPYPVSLRGLAIVLTVTALIGIAISRTDTLSTIALGLTPVIAFAYIGLTLMPFVNEIISTRPLIAALEKQHVAPEEIALYTCPYLWSRDFPRKFEAVRYGDPGNATVIATSRAHAKEIEATLRNYRKVDQLQMIGKWFDVYRK